MHLACSGIRLAMDPRLVQSARHDCQYMSENIAEYIKFI
jgi:hypothetical protein